MKIIPTKRGRLVGAGKALCGLFLLAILILPAWRPAAAEDLEPDEVVRLFYEKMMVGDPTAREFVDKYSRHWFDRAFQRMKKALKAMNLIWSDMEYTVIGREEELARVRVTGIIGPGSTEGRRESQRAVDFYNLKKEDGQWRIVFPRPSGPI